ncbi:hypothetical protein GJ496_006662 [Pomphorhynchus laevis]|nr:hypothetical protein GJ496_006662 [Pomphorhynchus laevis]
MYSLLDVYAAAGADVDSITNRVRTCASNLLLRYNQFRSQPGVAKFFDILKRKCCCLASTDTMDLLKSMSDKIQKTFYHPAVGHLSVENVAMFVSAYVFNEAT